jgi:hypothetical protein
MHQGCGWRMRAAYLDVGDVAGMRCAGTGMACRGYWWPVAVKGRAMDVGSSEG